MFNECIEFTSDLLLAAFSIIIYKTFFSIFLKEKRAGYYGATLWGIYFVWQIAMQQIEYRSNFKNIVATVIIISFICYKLYEGGNIERIVFVVLLLMMWMLTEVLLNYCFIIIKLNNTMRGVVGAYLSKIIMFCVIVSLRKFFRNESIRNLSNRYNMVLLILLVGSMFVIHNVFLFREQLLSEPYLIKGLMSLVILFIMNIIIFKLYLELSKEKEVQRVNTAYVQHLKICNQYMKEKEAIGLEFRKVRHDLKQHFMVLIEMLRKGEYNLAIAYLEKVISIDHLDKLGISRTDNITIDALINMKYAIAQKKGIKLDTDIHIPMELPFDDADLSVLLGNVLDNAIEASIQLDKELRHIKLYMKYDVNVLIISVSNKYNGEIERSLNGKILTNKEDPNNHGIGLESIKRVTEKYYGSMVIETKPDTFVIKMILCDLPKKLQEGS